MGGYAWVTLATNNSYCLGALVLAHSLKKSNTAHKLAVLITPAVSEPMREQLQTVFDVVKTVDVLDSKDEAHLALMQRPDLGITFTKIHCWRLTEFEKCVFLDADTLVVRNCDELFEREEFSAAPDVSWPDCFNSGVFVYKPSVETFNKLLQFAVENRSFDGGDQGLLNQFFSDWATEDIKKHLPFVYNLTSVAAYSYIPAFKHYGSETRIVHFIGAGKPWLQQLDAGTRTVTPTSGSEHLAPLLQQWWDLFCEKVHPNLDKNLDGMSHPPVDVCSNSLPIALTDEPFTSHSIEPCTPYREKDDFRQHNLPYQPFNVRGSSGELLNIEFLLSSSSPSSPPPEPEEQPPTIEEKEEIMEDYTQKPKNEVVEETKKSEIVEDCSQECQQQQEEPPPSPKDPFDYHTFFPDESCISNYLEQNVMTYQPFECHHENPEQVSPPLPRFLTIPENDKRQSGNTETHPPIEHHKAPTPPKESTFQRAPTPPRELTFQRVPTPPRAPSPPRQLTFQRAPTPPRELTFQSAPRASPGELTKSKSMPYLHCDVTRIQQQPQPTEPPRSIWKSQPDLSRKFSMPKLRPILPKQNSFGKSVPSSIPKVTLYTEFLMSAEYKDPVDLPKDKEGFVVSQIQKEGKLKRSKSDADIRTKFGPLPYSLSPEVAKPTTQTKHPFRHLDNEFYDLAQCKRQMGNKPKPPGNIQRKEIIRPLPALKPLQKPTKTQVRKRKSKENFPQYGGREKSAKREPQPVKDKKRTTTLQNITANGNNLEQILQRLKNYSKDYQHFFGVEPKRTIMKNSTTQENECVTSEPFELVTMPGSCRSRETQTFQLEFRQFRNYVRNKRETSQKGLLGIQDIVSPESKKTQQQNENDNLRLAERINLQQNKQLESEEITNQQVEKNATQLKNQQQSIKSPKRHIQQEGRDPTVKGGTSGSKRQTKDQKENNKVPSKHEKDIHQQEIFEETEQTKQNLTDAGGVDTVKGTEKSTENQQKTVRDDESIKRDNSRTKQQGTVVREKLRGNRERNPKDDAIVEKDSSEKKEQGKVITVTSTSNNQQGEIASAGSTSQDLIDNRIFETDNSTSNQREKKETATSKANEQQDLPGISERDNQQQKKQDLHLIKELDSSTKDQQQEQKDFERKSQQLDLTDSSITDLQQSKHSNLYKTTGMYNNFNGTHNDSVKGGRQTNGHQEPTAEETMIRKHQQKVFTAVNGVTESANQSTASHEVANGTLNSLLCVPDFDTPRTSRVTPSECCRKTFQNGVNISPDEIGKEPSLSSSSSTSFPPSNRNEDDKQPKDRMTTSGIAGAIAQLNLNGGTGQSPESTAAASSAHQEYIRRQNWETGNMDYMGKDSFDNIWSKICETLEGKESEGSPCQQQTGDKGSSVSLSTILDKCPEYMETLVEAPPTTTAPIEDDEIIFSKIDSKQPSLRNIVEEKENPSNVKLSDILGSLEPKSADGTEVKPSIVDKKSQEPVVKPVDGKVESSAATSESKPQPSAATPLSKPQSPAGVTVKPFSVDDKSQKPLDEKLQIPTATAESKPQPVAPTSEPKSQTQSTPTSTETKPLCTPTSTETKPLSTPTSTETKPLSTPTSTETKPLSTPTSTETKPLSTPTSTETKPLLSTPTSESKPQSFPPTTEPKPQASPVATETKPQPTDTKSQPSGGNSQTPIAGREVQLTKTEKEQPFAATTEQKPSSVTNKESKPQSTAVTTETKPSVPSPATDKSEPSVATTEQKPQCPPGITEPKSQTAPVPSPPSDIKSVPSAVTSDSKPQQSAVSTADKESKPQTGSVSTETKPLTLTAATTEPKPQPQCTTVAIHQPLPASHLPPTPEPSKCTTVALPSPPIVIPEPKLPSEPIPLPPPVKTTRSDSLKDEGKQKKGVFTKILEMVGVAPKETKSVFYDEQAEEVKPESTAAPPPPETLKKSSKQAEEVKPEPTAAPPPPETLKKSSKQAEEEGSEQTATAKPSETSGKDTKQTENVKLKPIATETTKEDPNLLKVDNTILPTPPVEAVRDKATSEIEEILGKAKTEVESILQERRASTTDPGESTDLVNTMKLIMGEEKPTEDIEELRVTTEEERKRHKGEPGSSKLSDQILKAIPPPRRKAISEASASTSAIPKATGEQKPAQGKHAKPSSIPVPPPRSRGKPTPPPPNKGKGKK